MKQVFFALIILFIKIGNGQTTASITVSPTTTTTYSVLGFNNSLACFGNSSVTVTVINGPPSGGFTFNEFDNCEEQSVTFTSNASNATYTWNFGDGTSPVTTTTNPYTHTYTIPGYFQVTLTASNACGSSTSSPQIIYIVPSIGAYNPGCCMKNFDYSNQFFGNSENITLTGTPWAFVQSFNIKGTLTIKSGTTLTVNPGVVIGFGPQGKVIVEQGATLIINGGTFTSVNFTSCSPSLRMMWQGVEVWGTKSSANPSLQGKIILKNNAMIEDAHYGITIGQWKFEPLASGNGFSPYCFNLNSAGGGIQSTNSNFNRNGVSINFFGHKSSSSARVVFNCNFTCKTAGINGELLDTYYNINNTPNTYENGMIILHNRFFPGMYIHPNTNPSSLLGIYQFNTHQVVLNNNSFEYIQSSMYSIDARYNINNCHFKDVLVTGIEISGTNIAYFGHTINNNTFKKFSHGITIIGGAFDRIKNNFFNFPLPFGPISENYSGIELGGTQSFSINDNVFNKLNTAINCNNSSISSNASIIGYESKGNIFNECLLGLLLTNNNSMLNVRCNSYDNPTPGLSYFRNWHIVSGQMANQGQFSATNEKKPVGNRFQFTTGGSARKEIKTVPSFYYFSHSAPADRIPIADGPVTINSTSIASSSFQNSCAPVVSTGCNPCNKQAMAQDSIKMLQLQAEYNSVQINLDKGQTTNLITAINHNKVTPAGQLKDMLLAASPLSDSVLISFINRSVAQTPPGIFKDVIIPNSPVSDKVKEQLDPALESLPTGIAHEIKNAQEVNPDYRTLTALEREIVQTEISRQLYLNTLISNYAEEDSMELIVELLESENTVSANQLLIGIYLADSNLSAAAAKLALLTSVTSEDSIFKVLYELYLNLGLNEKTYWDMDSAEFSTVREIAEMCPETRTILNARAVLWITTGEAIPDCPGLPSLRLSQNINDNNYEKRGESYIRGNENDFYLGNNIPNPFDNKTHIPYYLSENSNAGMISIYTLAGNWVSQYELPKGKGTLEVPTNNLENGIYMYNIAIDGKIKQSKRMVVIK